MLSIIYSPQIRYTFDAFFYQTPWNHVGTWRSKIKIKHMISTGKYSRVHNTKSQWWNALFLYLTLPLPPLFLAFSLFLYIIYHTSYSTIRTFVASVIKHPFMWRVHIRWYFSAIRTFGFGSTKMFPFGECFTHYWSRFMRQNTLHYIWSPWNGQDKVVCSLTCSTFGKISSLSQRMNWRPSFVTASWNSSWNNK